MRGRGPTRPGSQARRSRARPEQESGASAERCEGMEKPAARGGRRGGLSQVLTAYAAKIGRRGSHRPVAGTLTGWHRTHNGPSGPSFERGGIRSPGGKARFRGVRLRRISAPSMTPTESHILGLNGLALAWESVAVVLGALV